MGRDFHAIAEKTLAYGGVYGLEHSLRLIGLAKKIAGDRSCNADVIAFSAYVHDFGGYPPFLEAGKGHAARSLEVLPEFIAMYDFSGEEAALIREAVALHHSAAKPYSFEATLLRDADALDFLGYIGVARDLMRFGKDFQKGLEAVRRHRMALPGVLFEEEAVRMAKARMEEMDAFLSGLEEEHFELLS